MNIVAEAIMVGTICTIVGTVVFYIVAVTKQSLQHSKLQKDKKLFSQIISPQLLISLFLTGFLGHIFFEVTGINTKLHRWTGFWLW
jgi:hypothetical protein